MIRVIHSSLEHLDDLLPLFDNYRIFYNQESDLLTASKFLENRFENNECEVFMAYVKGKPVGFTLLYTAFSSVSLQPVYILNDLYVLDDYRQKGIGELLLNKAKEYCKEKGFKGLALETATDNPAQHLYEKLGWIKDAHCFHYFWTAE